MTRPEYIETARAWIHKVVTGPNPNRTSIGVASTEPMEPDTIELVHQLADTQEILRFVAVLRNGQARLVARAFSGRDASKESREWYAKERTRADVAGTGKTLHEYDPLARE